RRNGGPRAGRPPLFRPAVPLPLGATWRGQVRPHPTAESGPAAAAWRCGDRRAAADHRRVREPVPRAGPGGADLMLVSDAVGAVLADLGADTVFGVVGSGNFHVTNALMSRGARVYAARHEGG